MDNNLINKYKSEFRSEIANSKVSVDELKKMGVTDFALQSEIFLRKHYGEDILMEDDVVVEVDVSKKKIEKVDLKKISSVSELTKYIDEIPRSEFDRNVELMLTKVEKNND